AGPAGGDPGERGRGPRRGGGRGSPGAGGEPAEGRRALRRGATGAEADARPGRRHPDGLPQRRGGPSRRPRQPGGGGAGGDPRARGPRPRRRATDSPMAAGKRGDDAMSPKKIVIPLVLVAAAGAGAWYFFGRPKPDESKLTASGTVEATEAQLGFQATGRIAEVAVREGDRVHAGQVLARLDPAEAEARRAQAAGQVEAARAASTEL